MMYQADDGFEEEYTNEWQAVIGFAVHTRIHLAGAKWL
jgi:hypothetical protein